MIQSNFQKIDSSIEFNVDRDSYQEYRIANQVMNVIDNLASSVNTFKPQDLSLTIYNPLVYARAPIEEYVKRFFCEEAKVLFLGMNPGPFGMAQTGIPFGDVVMVKEWMGINMPVSKPPVEHPKRPVSGFFCTRREVSGSRLWGWAKDKFGEPENFFKDFFVWNYCPLVFMESTGANRTPDKLTKEEISLLYFPCDEALRSLVSILKPKFVIGVGKFAMKRAMIALQEELSKGLVIGDILHPSPASPKANQNWAKVIDDQLRFLGCINC
ncbi:MAG TPA: DUF4918 family protein [Oligoflexia bacterium]|nr:DUF4918 family protein [Oligoflexia bacterium]HMP47767.1 DUF4918 family protein [Oligoflexia bacterium]